MCQAENISKILLNDDIRAKTEVNVFLLNSVLFILGNTSNVKHQGTCLYADFFISLTRGMIASTILFCP